MDGRMDPVPSTRTDRYRLGAYPTQIARNMDVINAGGPRAETSVLLCKFVCRYVCR